MRPYTNEEAFEIAGACRAYIEAHSQRSPQATCMTPRESETLDALRWKLAVREREALSAAMGTAA